jgi:hypothetical protein
MAGCGMAEASHHQRSDEPDKGARWREQDKTRQNKAGRRSDVDSKASRATQSWHAAQRRRSYAEERDECMWNQADNRFVISTPAAYRDGAWRAAGTVQHAHAA